jgi:hypothetical protein
VSVTTTTGTGTVACLLTSVGTSVALPMDVTTSLLQTASATITATGHRVAFLMRTVSTNDNWCQLSLTIDGTEVYSDSSGKQDNFSTVLTVGSHTVTFVATAFNSSLTMLKCGLTVFDLGI